MGCDVKVQGHTQMLGVNLPFIFSKIYVKNYITVKIFDNYFSNSQAHCE